MSLTIKFVRDDKKIFILGGEYRDSSSWGITKLTGLGTLQNEIDTEKPAVGDGLEIISERIPSRNIDIVANVKNKNNNAIERNNALTFFNPKHSFTMYVIRDEVTRWIVSKIEKVQCSDKIVGPNLEISLALTCPDPFFYSKDNYGKNIASVTAGFGFPFMSRIGVGFRVGTYNFAKQIEIENTGDVETYATIVIEAYGEVENPKIVQNNAFIRLIDNLVDGDVVEIDLVENSIRKNGINCIGKVDRKSSFSDMVLYTGDNTISFTADNGDTNMKVVLYYNLKYLGV